MNRVVDLQPVPQRKRSPKVDRAFERITQEAKTFADIIRISEEEILETDRRLENAISTLPTEQRNALREVIAKTNAEMKRRLEPWPTWVVRLAAEIFAVRLPTIPKALIHEGFTLLHFCIFEWRLDRSVPFPKHSFGSLDLESLDPALLGAMLGHSVAHAEGMQRKIDAHQPLLDKGLEKGILSPSQHADFAKHREELSTEKVMDELSRPLMEWLKNNPKFLLRFSEGLGNAKTNTFDKNGNEKEPPLMRIYEKIFLHWPEVEAMSGPTEFCRFLESELNEKHPDKRMNRAKAIRRRLGIVFRGKAGGTTSSNSPYLPHKA